MCRQLASIMNHNAWDKTRASGIADGSGELNSDEQARLFEVYDPYTGTSLPRAALIAYAEAAAAAEAADPTWLTDGKWGVIQLKP